MSDERLVVPEMAQTQHGNVASEVAHPPAARDDDRIAGERISRDAYTRTDQQSLSLSDDGVAAIGEQLAAVNERLRAENEAFRASIDANVSLRSVIRRLEDAVRELETSARSLEAEVSAARARTAAQSLELASTEPSGRREQPQQGQTGVHDSAERMHYEQKVTDLAALIKQLQDDRKIKLALLETREALLQEKQAAYEDLEKKYGHDVIESLQQTLHQQNQSHSQDNNGVAVNATVTSRSCNVM